MFFQSSTTFFCLSWKRSSWQPSFSRRSTARKQNAAPLCSWVWSGNVRVWSFVRYLPTEKWSQFVERSRALESDHASGNSQTPPLQRAPSNTVSVLSCWVTNVPHYACLLFRLLGKNLEEKRGGGRQIRDYWLSSSISWNATLWFFQLYE